MDLKAVLVVEDLPPSIGDGSAPARQLEHGAFPRALERVANRPIAHHAVDALESVGIAEVVVVSSQGNAARVRECLSSRGTRTGSKLRRLHGRARLRHVQGPAVLDLAEGLRLAAPLIDEAPYVVQVASGLLGGGLEPVVSRLRGGSPDVILAVHHGLPVNHLSPATQEMLHLAALHPERVALSMAGLLAFGPGALRQASAARWHRDSDDGEIDLTAVAERISSIGGWIDVLPVTAWCEYVGRPVELLELNRIALDQLETELHRPSTNGNRIEGRVWIHHQAAVRESVIVGPAVIGPGARVTDAYIGPYTSIGARAVIECAEVERSIIAAGASVVGIEGRLAASVVGRNARVFRDSSLPRAMRIQVGDGTEVALC
jgi:glucose-1-phosphate thymidylyltransferase